MALYKKTLVVDGITPVGAYAALRKNAGGGSFLLESVVPGERWGRYSILGYRPERKLSVYGKRGVDPFAELEQLSGPLIESSGDVADRFVDANVGLLNYDLVHYATKVEPWPGMDQRPLARLISGCTVVIFDNLTHTALIASRDLAELERVQADLSQAAASSWLGVPDKSQIPADLEVNMSDADYCKVVDRAKEYIRAGDAFQIVPARTFSVSAEGANPFEVYRALRVLSPAPYMYLLELPADGDVPAIAVAGASPETLVRVENGQLTLRPIAGTRRRGRTAEEDLKLAEEMINDPKERAEHVMLIDLARNDAGRVSQSGSVKLVHNMLVERYSHVMHIVSEVQGTLRPEISPWQAIAATFPPGTLTGAPKVRAMQIIRELEAAPRGTYGGAVGYITRGRDFDLAIAIRTVVMQNGRFEVTAGAGVVADSIPELEAKETRNKASAALAAICAARNQRGNRG